MRIPCPFCGDRDAHEFTYRGDAAPVRPNDEGALYAYVYERANVAGRMGEHWYHAHGCRNWLVVTRDTTTHEILSTALASGASA